MTTAELIQISVPVVLICAAFIVLGMATCYAIRHDDKD